ncbi:MAG: Gfo/Idh/MocA family oxidoreductase [Opitutales bacterium]|jgi:predicted dehydrogenase|nr:Gfo/Idh/MocA family oxidoreductase [Opitutales bacterium]MDP4643849.1 Gfo/Idh/MocA family oxidoreductase [Opitutales bacterium]MDP4777379.1 Gfo/Idh/MocA family oxidoreductase [Opitutales bacterium]MDP4880413.1 Gfo/Idh/MocA family oxidoreductase [Opitutales bacterium]MDP5079668.1 Gfo/Idh/MocA family oxidoreductase [Opitutales bacterium]
MIDCKPQLPLEPRPIYIFGAGGIVKDAHLPAYKQAGFTVAGITNRTRARAETLAQAYDIADVYDSAEALIAAAPANAVFDLTLMPAQFVPTLELLPDGAAVLIQKPMGDSLPEALEILEVCRRKNLVAAINCQLRFAPFVIAARNLVESGAIGELYDMEVRVSVQTPWDLFPNVKFHPRLEIAQHSVHHIDLVRSFLGNPSSVMAKTVGHPAKPMSSTRTGMIMDYGDKCRAVLSINHDHDFGSQNQESFIKWEGTKGAIKARMGLLMNYPDGAPDKFEYCILKEGEAPQWVEQKLEGSWFPEAFIGTMSSLMCYLEGSASEMPTSVENVVNTMAVVEAAYASSGRGGVEPDFQS